MKFKHGVYWGEKISLATSFYYGFCPDETGWKTIMKHLKQVEPYPTGSHGRCTWFELNQNMTALVTLDNIPENARLNRVLALLVHEAVHVKQCLSDYIQERDGFSYEIEARIVEQIVCELFEGYFASGREPKQ